MAEATLILWRDIPAQLSTKAGRRTAKRELPARFAEAIDMAAMRAGMAGSDDYLAEWRREPLCACGDDLEMEADRLVQEIEAAWPAERLASVARAGGITP
jgi:Virulence factor